MCVSLGQCCSLDKNRDVWWYLMVSVGMFVFDGILMDCTVFDGVYLTLAECAMILKDVCTVQLMFLRLNGG